MIINYQKKMKKYYNIEDEKVLLKFLKVNGLLLQDYYQMIDQDIIENEV